MAETSYTPFASEPDAVPVRLIVRRVQPTPNSQLALLVDYSYHGFITDRDGDMELEADHRRREIENAIRDLKYVSTTCPRAASPPFQTMAHNLARWTTRLGLGEPVATTKTLRRRFFSLAGRLTRKAPPHFESPPGLALAKPVQQRPGQLRACHSLLDHARGV